jgi:UDP-N-acetylmuramate--alanine ligase
MKQNWNERLRNRDKSLHVHLIGIGGAGLSAIARVLLEMQMRVSGSDRRSGDRAQRLVDAGATVYPQQVAANLVDLEPVRRPDVVLISSAIAPDNPERAAAEALGIPVVKRNDFLAALLASRTVVAVAGSHGKSTTTSMIVQMLRTGGLDVGYIIGTDLPGYGNASAGSHDIFVIEADEYDHMFLGLRPAVAVITNVEWDHPDCFPTPRDFAAAFEQFVAQLQPGGCVISCADDAGAEALHAAPHPAQSTWIRYGLAADADLRALDPQPAPECGLQTALTWRGEPAGQLALQVLGLHNVRNALAAACVGRWCGLPMDDLTHGLGAFLGSARRLEWKGEANGITVLDDYAHHPTEVRATLAALRQRYPQQRVWAVFQPHTFSRTHQMLDEMAQSFCHADRVLVLDIYAAREQDTGLVSAADVVAHSSHPAIQHIARLDEAAAYLARHAQPGDVVVTLGAGDSYVVGETLLAHLQTMQPDEVYSHAEN